MSLLTEIGLGLYVGVLTGAFTAFLAFGLSFGFRYVAGVKLSDRLGLVIGLAAAGLQGGFLGIIRDPELLRSPTIAAALLSVMMITMYAHAKGKDLADALPRGSITQVLWRRTLSADAVERIGRFGQVRIRVQGEVGDVAGYPPLSDRLRAQIADGEWKFPADLPLSELESRLSDRLQTEYDLPAVQVAINTGGRARIAAAPPSGALSRRVPPDKRAVSVEARLPSGLARGDELELVIQSSESTATDAPAAGGGTTTTDGAATTHESMPVDGPTTADGPTATDESKLRRVRGTVVSVTPADGSAGDGAGAAETDGPEDEESESVVVAAAEQSSTGSAGGTGRVTVALAPETVPTVVTGTVRGLLVRSKGGDAAFELVALLGRQGNRFRKVTVRPDSRAVDAQLVDLHLRGEYGVDVLAIRRAGEWQFSPSRRARLQAGDELFAVGPRAGLDALAEVSV